MFFLNFLCLILSVHSKISLPFICSFLYSGGSNLFPYIKIPAYSRMDHKLEAADSDLKCHITPWLNCQPSWFQRQMVLIQPLNLFGGYGHVDFDPTPDMWDLTVRNISVCDAQQNRIAAKGYPHQGVAALRGL